MTTPSQICGTGFSCQLDATLRIISGKWKPPVLFFLLDCPKRYGKLKRMRAFWRGTLFMAQKGIALFNPSADVGDCIVRSRSRSATA
jgi:hypothetical protein